MKHQTLAMANGFERYTKKTRRTLFLEEMEQVVPWGGVVCAGQTGVCQGREWAASGGGQKQMACLVARLKPPATTVSAHRCAVKITCSEIP
jgi:hypothetical protein